MKKASVRTSKRIQGKTLDEFVSELCKYLATGVTVKTATAAVGISESTYHLWLRKGHEGIEPYATFTAKIRETFPKTEAVLARRIINASEKDWRAAAWMLERRNRADWGKSYASSDDLSNDFINNLTIEELRNEIRKMYSMSTENIEQRAEELEQKLANDTKKNIDKAIKKKLKPKKAK